MKFNAWLCYECMIHYICGKDEVLKNMMMKVEEVERMKSYVNKNQYGYDVFGVIIDDENKIVNYSPCMMPIGKHTKATKKAIREMVEMYQKCGYRVVIK